MADLITLEDYKDANGLTKPDDDARLESLISSISQLVKTYCSNSFVDYFTSDKTEYFNIDMSTYTIQVAESPIVSITSVEERANPGSSYSTLSTAATEYYVDIAADCIYRTSTGGYAAWPLGPGAVRVIYKAGFSTIPLDLKLAVLDLVGYYHKDEYKERKTLGSASITNNPSSTQWRNVGFPDHIKRVLDLYKNVQM